MGTWKPCLLFMYWNEQLILYGGGGGVPTRKIPCLYRYMPIYAIHAFLKHALQTKDEQTEFYLQKFSFRIGLFFFSEYCVVVNLVILIL